MSDLEYKVGDRVGSGGSGVVYRAKLRDGRPAAVKRLRSADADAELLEEARNQARLSHPNLVKFYGVGTRDDSLDLIMEWVDTSLADLLARASCDGPMAPSLALHIVREVLEALEYLHGEGWVHRDVKPRNILVAEDGAVKLGDFGLIRRIAEQRTTSVLRGTLAYMSPEHRLSNVPIDGRSDLFSVGVTLYELLTGALPYAGLDDLQSGRPYTPVTARRREIPGEFDALVAALLHFDRDERPGSASDALALLPDGATLEPAVAQADLLAWRRRNPPASESASDATRPAELPADDSAPRESRPRRTGLMAAASLALGILLGAGILYMMVGQRPEMAPGGEAVDGQRTGLDSPGDGESGNGSVLPEESPGSQQQRSGRDRQLSGHDEQADAVPAVRPDSKRSRARKPGDKRRKSEVRKSVESSQAETSHGTEGDNPTATRAEESAGTFYLSPRGIETVDLSEPGDRDPH